MVIKNQFSFNYKHDCDLGQRDGTLNLCIQWCCMAMVCWGEILGAAIISGCLHNIIRDCPIWRGERWARDYADAMRGLGWGDLGHAEIYGRNIIKM